LAIANWHLDMYREGYYLPDVCHEEGLKADIDALTSRLRAVVATLKAQGGGQGHE
jgi:hypothetical protein